MSSEALRFILEGANWRTGLCSRFMQAAEDLIHTAKGLRADLEEFKKAPDPFAALVSTVHNNREFDKFSYHAVDTGTKAGVGAFPIKTAPGPKRSD